MFSKEDVVKLRKQTGAGILDCQKALKSTSGDMEEAVYFLRKKGLAKAAKKADRSANEGVVSFMVSDDLKKAAVISLNCETDFVAKNEDFIGLSNNLAKMAMDGSDMKSDEVDGLIKSAIATFGENIVVSDIQKYDTGGYFYGYVHSNRKLVVLVELSKASAEKGKDVAMHIAAMAPTCVSHKELDKNLVEREREAFREELANSGKPSNVVDMIIEGKMKNFYKTCCLMDQSFVKEPKQTVREFLKDIDVLSFKRVSL